MFAVKHSNEKNYFIENITGVTPLVTKKNKIILGSSAGLIVFIAVILAIMSAFSNKQVIEASGIVEADNTEVPSLVSGLVEEITLKEGAKVNKNDVILVIDDSKMQIRKEQAESIVEQAEAGLEMIKNGASPEDIKQLQAKVNQARANFQTISSGARPEEINQAKAKVDSTKIAFNTAEKEFNSAKKLFEQDIISKKKFDQVKIAYETAKAQHTAAQEALKLLKKGAKSTQKTIAQQQVIESLAALKKVKDGATPAEIKTAEAQVKQVKAELELIEQAIADSKIKATGKGTINTIAANKGELVIKGSSVASIIDLENLWVKVFVPESKLFRLKDGQPAKIIPDAMKSVSFPGYVSYIAQKGAFIPPGTKESADQQVFEIKIKIDKTAINDILLRPGMSVSVVIDTSKEPVKKKIAKES